MSKKRLETIEFNAGGVDNHNVYWDNLSPKNQPSRMPSRLRTAVAGRFGSSFRKKFMEAALAHRGSGWCWLVLDKKNKLQIECTGNQDSLRSCGCTPLLGCDLWEHAYYLKHRSDRRGYLQDFWRAVNWGDVSRRLPEGGQRYKQIVRIS